jgi:ERF superfamily protein
MSDQLPLEPPEPKPAPKPKGLIAKLCEVMAEAGYIQKRGRNDKFNYNYATEADVVDMLREKLASRGVFVFPSIVQNARSEHSKTSSGNIMWITEIMVRWRFVDAETGEAEECMMPGSGTDTGDKGIYKAITGSSKYMFLKGFMLPTGDDPEDEKPDKDDIKAKKKAAQDVGKQQAQAAKDRMNEPVELVQVGTDKLGLRGNGVALVRAEMSEQEKSKCTFKYDRVGNWWTIPLGDGNMFASLCEKYGVKCTWIEPQP